MSVGWPAEELPNIYNRNEVASAAAAAAAVTS